MVMNNAGIGLRGTSWAGLENWKKVFDVNVFGYVSRSIGWVTCLSVADPEFCRSVVNVQQVFVPVCRIDICHESIDSINHLYTPSRL